MTKANVVLAAAAVVFAAGCLLLFRDLSTERNRVHALEAQVAQLQREVTSTQSPPPEPPEPTAVPQPAATPANATASTPAIDKPAVAQANAERDIQRRVNADPAYRGILLSARRAGLQPQHPQLAAELGLSKDEEERFLDLLAEQSLRETEMVRKQPPGDVQEQRKKLFAQQEQERRKFLGEQRFQLWREYVNSAGARSLVSELRTQLATTNSPLREEQIKPLVKALAAEQQRHWAEREENYTTSDPAATIEERVSYMERRAKLIEESMARSSEAGAMYLDSTQQRVLDAMLARQSERARAEVVSWRAFWEADERARAAPGSR
jgi:hypothetical protein